MDEMDELATAAKQAWRRPYQPRPNNKPVVMTVVIVIVLLGAFAAIVWFMRPTPPVVVQQPPTVSAEELEVQQTTTAHLRFNAFAGRLASALSKEHRLALQAAAPKGGTYNCSYNVRKTEVKKPRDAQTPGEYAATFTGSVDWKDEEDNTSAETYKIAATFTDADGTWQIAKATSEVLTHKDSAGLFGDVVKIGQIKNLAPINWFNAAVANAQKSE